MAAAIDSSPGPVERVPKFRDLGIGPALCEGLEKLGFETPTPIQAEAIPHFLEGRDLIGQAQTGTGKTAAFGLPLLQQLDLADLSVQGLILAPTRELARQVTEALEKFASELPGFRVITVYGGAPYRPQLRALHRGVHVVVGTPGRVIDCIERGALVLDNVRIAVLDEADEMLRMGFVEEVETILERTPDDRQMALFSATMPKAVRRIADAHLNQPVSLSLAGQQRSVDGIEQRAMILAERDKLEALARIIEVEQSEATLVFARTQVRCQELAEALETRGLGAAPLHGGLNQAHREDVVRRLREGRLDLVVATDVAARGLDVDNITHVINYDPPQNPEIYLHRIGRTGRAGRQGTAILMLTPRDRRVWSSLERFTRRKLTRMQIPSNAQLAAGRRARFAAQVTSALQQEDLGPYRELVADLLADGADASSVAAAIALVANRHKPFIVADQAPKDMPHESSGPRRQHRDKGSRFERAEPPSGDWTRLFVSLGHSAGLRPGDLVGAVANELNISGKNVGAIDIRDRFSFFEVASEHAERVVEVMGSTQIRGRRAGITLARPAAARPDGDTRPRGKRNAPSGNRHSHREGARAHREGDSPSRGEQKGQRASHGEGGRDGGKRRSFAKGRDRRPLPHKRRGDRPFGGAKKRHAKRQG